VFTGYGIRLPGSARSERATLLHLLGSDWRALVMVGELGEGFPNRRGAQCVALFKTGQVEGKHQ